MVKIFPEDKKLETAIQRANKVIAEINKLPKVLEGSEIDALKINTELSSKDVSQSLVLLDKGSSDFLIKGTKVITEKEADLQFKKKIVLIKGKLSLKLYEDSEDKPVYYNIDENRNSIDIGVNIPYEIESEGYCQFMFILTKPDKKKVKQKITEQCQIRSL